MDKAARQKKNAIQELLTLEFVDSKNLSLLKRRISKKYSIQMLANSEIIKEYKSLISKKIIKSDLNKEKILRRRSVRTLSGIAPVAVLTKPFDCPGTCVYCPNEKNVPRSYLSNEPAVMRAIRCSYDPYVQVTDRLRALEANGHEPTKIELIVIGGTWSVLPKKYKYWYVANLFASANRFKETSRYKISYSKSHTELKKMLIKEQKRNEKAKYKIIGLTLETRPDYINKKELLEMRELGCTRVELGVQAIDDKILELNKRGHGVKAIAEATKLLKDYGFKVTYHIMPALPGSSVNKDYKMFKELFSDERFQPDQIKFYPTVVTKGSQLYKWWKQGKYKPYTDKELQNLIIKCKKVIPEYVRIIRLIRDIPGESIEAGNTVTNLRQVMQSAGVECNCIRCREVKGEEYKVKNASLKVEKYKASGGEEYFISYNSRDNKKLYGFCRLRVINRIKKGIIRELHVYGELVSVGSKKQVQHSGLGKKLLKKAESISKKYNCKEISVISGVGVRDYYRKNGYRLSGTYMKKSLTK